MTMTAAPKARTDSGIILIAVLLMVAIMSMMVVAAAALTRANAGAEQLEQKRLATHFALRSGLEAAKALILATPPGDRLLFDGTAAPLALNDGLTVAASIRDVAGLVDLNRSEPALIEALARSAGLAAKIEELRKEAAPPGAQVKALKSQPAMTAGAEAAPQQPAPPVIFLAVDQLAPLLDKESRTDADAPLEALFTVFNPTGKVNPFAAPDEVLAAIPGLSSSDIAGITAARKSRRGSKDAFVSLLLERMQESLAVGEASVFAVEVRLEAGQGILPGARIDAVVLLASEGALPFRTLAANEQ